MTETSLIYNVLEMETRIILDREKGTNLQTTDFLTITMQLKPGAVYFFAKWAL